MTSTTPGAELPGQDLDESVLLRLFDLAGPVQTVEILDRLVLDLRAVQEALARGRDVMALRRQIHALTGIAGTVGAMPLHQSALAVGKLLRDEPTPPRERVTALLPAIQRLIDRLTEMRAAR